MIALALLAVEWTAAALTIASIAASLAAGGGYFAPGAIALSVGLLARLISSERQAGAGFDRARQAMRTGGVDG